MDKTKFFGVSGLTSTSANHIANMAKEYYQALNEELENIKWYDTTIQLISANENKTLSKGQISTEINATVDKIYKCKALIAWLREALKAKDEIVRSIKNTTLTEFLIKWYPNADEVKVEEPTRPNTYTDEDYWATKSVSEHFRYLDLETKVSTYGKFIHPNGRINDSKKDLINIINNPTKVSGNGRDTVIYEYVPCVELSSVEDMFFALQKTHREAQAELNSMKHDMEMAISRENDIRTEEYNTLMSEYQKIRHGHTVSYETWKQTSLEEARNLKIIIPNQLQGIYKEINDLGK